MIYRVHIDMTSILHLLSRYRLGKFDNEYLTLEIEAKDPDDACYLAFKALCDIILKQDSSTEAKVLLKNIKNDFRVYELE